jgi:hypothetical protein
VSDLFDPLVPAASYDDLSAGGRISCLILAGCLVLYLTLTTGERALDRTVGYGMLAVGLLSPVVYPWYLLGGVACLVPAARGARRDWLVVLSAIGCLLSPPGFNSQITTYLGIAAVAGCLVVIAPRELRRQRGAREAAAVVAPVAAPPRTVAAYAPAAPAPPVTTG